MAGLSRVDVALDGQAQAVAGPGVLDFFQTNGEHHFRVTDIMSVSTNYETPGTLGCFLKYPLDYMANFAAKAFRGLPTFARLRLGLGLWPFIRVCAISEGYLGHLAKYASRSIENSCSQDSRTSASSLPWCIGFISINLFRFLSVVLLAVVAAADAVVAAVAKADGRRWHLVHWFVLLKCENDDSQWVLSSEMSELTLRRYDEEGEFCFADNSHVAAFLPDLGKSSYRASCEWLHGMPKSSLSGQVLCECLVVCMAMISIAVCPNAHVGRLHTML